MKKTMKSMLGVTLLEIMLVLAIAAMVIVMSVRYYQSATQSQQANAGMQMVQGITAAADGLSQGSGTYNSVTNDNVKAMLPGKSLKTPWGKDVAITAGESSYSVTMTFTTETEGVCRQIAARVEANPKVSVTNNGCGSSPPTVTYTYNMYE